MKNKSSFSSFASLALLNFNLIFDCFPFQPTGRNPLLCNFDIYIFEVKKIILFPNQNTLKLKCSNSVLEITNVLLVKTQQKPERSVINSNTQSERNSLYKT